MVYEVTYQLDGEEHTDRVDADDAPTAASMVRRANERLDQRYELLLVHLVEAEAPIVEDAAGQHLVDA